VAANRKTICNSDAQLDLGDLRRPLPAALYSCLATPLVAGDSLVGVLALYAPERQAFSDQHRRLVEHTARPLAHLVKGTLELEKVQHVTGVGALSYLPLAADSVELPRPRKRR
jgi:GAF domain-containing protein